MTRNKLSDKVLVLGIDALDPRLTRKYVDMGIMPNVKQLIEKGSSRSDLTLLGGHPTVTPPMWTTLATGCYANVHGITGYWRQSKDLDCVEYNIDSRLCKAEQMWNITAEAGKKTLVFHWPGASWPPTSESENLYVVDGSCPGIVGLAAATMEGELIIGASEEFTEVAYMNGAASDSSMPCVMSEEDLPSGTFRDMDDAKTTEKRKLIMDESQLTNNIIDNPVDLVRSPLKPAENWANAPEGAKEFTILLSKGYVRRIGLLLKNESGIYDKIAIYKSKKDTTPLAVSSLGQVALDVKDEILRNDEKISTTRSYKLLKCDPEGKTLTLWVSAAMKTDVDFLFHPQSIYQEIVKNCGYLKPMSMLGLQDPLFVKEVVADTWKQSATWQSSVMNYLIKEKNIEVVFSHFHSVDLFDHLIIKHLANRPETKVSHEVVEEWMELNYKIADYYVGQFLHLLDEDWTILLVSDHGQVASKYAPPILGDTDGVNVKVLQELGYTVLKKDENGNDIPEIDWSKTKAVATRECNIYLNLKGRDPQGIVEPEEKYELEEQIMTDLYSYKHPVTRYRVVSLALRNKDAVLLGYGGPECGDICYWNAENYNADHADCLSTTYGEADTSCSPIFIAAGKGIKENFTTDRIIRQIDVAPTVAILTGLRMPSQCEGAPVYQIFNQEV